MRAQALHKTIKISTSFGSPLIGRTYTGDTSVKYRFGFNGKEKDNETYGDGNELDFGARIYNGRLGRFLSVDPLYRKFAGFSTYSSAKNSPIFYIDCEGAFGLEITASGKTAGVTQQNVETFKTVLNNIEVLLTNDNDLVQYLVRQTGLTQEQILDHVKADHGPTVSIVERNPGDLAFRAENEGLITVEASVVTALDEARAKSNNSKEAKEEYSGMVLAVASALLHEFTHTSDMEFNDPSKDPKNKSSQTTGEADGTPDGKQKAKRSSNKERGVGTERRMAGKETAWFKDSNDKQIMVKSDLKKFITAATQKGWTINKIINTFINGSYVKLEAPNNSPPPKKK